MFVGLGFVSVRKKFGDGGTEKSIILSCESFQKTTQFTINAISTASEISGAFLMGKKKGGGR